MKNLFWEKDEFKLWILLLCAYHFFPFITTKGSILLYVWAYVIPIGYIVWNFNYLKKVVSAIAYSEVNISLIGIVILSCLSIMIPILYNTGDFTYFTGAIMTMVKIAVRMLFIFMVIIKNIPNATKETFMKYFIFSCCLYISSTIVMIVFPGIKEIFYTLVKENEHSKTAALEGRYQTRYGWGGFSGFEYTFKCTLAIIFNNYLIEKAIKKKQIWFKIAISLFLLIGAMFYGRTGFLFGAVVMFVLFYELLKKRSKILLNAIFVFCAGLVVLLVLQSRNEAIGIWFDWAFDLFVTFFETGKIQTDSSNVLMQQMLFIPEIKTILLGDGLFTTAEGYYMFTDAGIMRSLLFGGIGFAVLRYLSVYIPLILNVIKGKTSKEDRRLFFWIFILCFILEIKGEIAFSCLPIYIWLIVIEKYSNRRENDGTRFKF